MEFIKFVKAHLINLIALAGYVILALACLVMYANDYYVTLTLKGNVLLYIAVFLTISALLFILGIYIESKCEQEEKRPCGGNCNCHKK